MAEKPHMNLVFIGHVDHGKSTLVGRTIYDTGALSEQEYRKLKESADAAGKGSFVFAYAMDNLKEERERGVTIDVSYRKFETQKHYFTIIDAPGHQDYVKNMVTGTSQSDAAVLVISAKEGIQEQTKEHAFLAFVMGIRQLVVAVNKMDEVNYDEKRFNEVKTEVTKLLSSRGYKPDQYKIIPVSAWVGENITKKPEKMPWWTGLALVPAIDEFKAPPSPTNKALRLPIQDVYNIKGVGTVPVGRVETGILKPGESLIFMPSGVVGEVKTIEMHHEAMVQAGPGDNIGFNVRGIARQDVNRGDVAGHTNNPPTVVDDFTAQIVVLAHPTAITVGYTPVFHMHTLQVSCTLTELQKKLDPKTGAMLEENPKFLKTGDAAIVKIKPTRAICVETYKDFPQLGRFAIRDMGKTVAAGMIISITPRVATSTTKK